MEPEPALVKGIRLDTARQTAGNTEVSMGTSFAGSQRPRQSWDAAWHEDNYHFGHLVQVLWLQRDEMVHVCTGHTLSWDEVQVF